MKSVYILLLAGTLAACGQPPPDDTAASKTEQGRKETRGIRNVEAVGVPGNKIADKVDQALDANEQQKKELDQTVENIDK